MSPIDSLSRRVDEIERLTTARSRALLLLAIFWVVLFVGCGTFAIFSTLLQRQTQRAVNTPACSIQSWATKRIDTLAATVGDPKMTADLRRRTVAAIKDYKFLRRSFRTIPVHYNCSSLLARLDKEAK